MKNKGRNNYFLLVSRLSRFTSYKKVELAVEAATRLSVPLVIVGEGDINYYKKKAGPTVTFVGKVTDKKLAFYYKNCKALIFPALEDFGLAMVEAQAMGKPVIAFKGGGALEIVKEGITGTFFEKQNVESLVEVLKNFDEKRYNSKRSKQNAKKFSISYFEKSLKRYILKFKK